MDSLNSTPPERKDTANVPEPETICISDSTLRENISRKSDDELEYMLRNEDKFTNQSVSIAREFLKRRESDKTTLALPTAISPEETNNNELPPTANPSNRNYLVRHWKGDLSVSRSFWLNTILLNCAIGISNYAIRSSGIALESIQASSIWILVSWFLLSIITVWQLTGVWKSAGKQYDTQVRLLARLAVTGLAVANCFGFYKGVLPQINEAFEMVSGDNKFPDFQVSILPDGKTVEFSGGLKLGASKRLREILSSAPYISLIRIETEGGRFGEALEIAAIIKERQLTTYVDTLCASAGVIPFLAGKERIIKNGAKIGFHSSSFAGKSNRELTTLTNQYFRRSGISESFINRVTALEEITFPDNRELLREKVITRVTNGEGFSRGSRELEAYTFESFCASLREAPIFRALESSYPSEFRSAAKEAYDAYRLGYSSKAMGKFVRPLIGRATAERFPKAGNLAMQRWLDFTIAFIRDNLAASPEEVLRKLNNSPEFDQSKVAKWPADLELRFFEALFEGESVVNTPYETQEAKERFKNIISAFTEDEIEILFGDSGTKTITSPELICSHYLKFYTMINKLPLNQKGAVCRLMFSKQ